MEQAEEGWDIVTVGGFFIVVSTVLFFIRTYIKGGQFTEKVSAKNTVMLVTGANSGIGRQLCRELNQRGAKVYMLCRSVERGNEAVRFLFSKYGCDATRLLVRQCDLASFDSVRKFCAAFNKEEDHVDVLVNNAGVMFLPSFNKTEDGNELTLQSNHLGHFLLTELLLPKLEAAPNGARIVNLSSALHLHADTADLHVLNSKQNYSMLKSYYRSKLANVLHAVELTKRLRRRNSASQVVANACHPGAVDTNLVRFPLYQSVVRKVFAPIIWFLMKTDQDGAQTPLYLALGKKVNGVSGKYFSDCGEAKPHPLAHDEQACQTLYNQSIELCKLENID